MKDRINALIWVTLCVTLLCATLGILDLMSRGVNVAAPVSLAVVAQWAALLAAVVRRER